MAKQKKKKKWFCECAAFENVAASWELNLSPQGLDLSDLWLPMSWWMEEVITEWYFDIKVCLFHECVLWIFLVYFFSIKAFPEHFHLPIESLKHIFAQLTAPGQVHFSLVQTRFFFFLSFFLNQTNTSEWEMYLKLKLYSSSSLYIFSTDGVKLWWQMSLIASPTFLSSV